jgi:Tfp pilus assembly protein PilN
MPQQINLCTPILLTQKRYFSAQTMLQALAVFIVLGGGLCAYGVWSLNAASSAMQATLSSQAGELERLQAAIGSAKNKTSSALADVGVAQALQRRRAELAQREKLAQELQRGLLRPGWGHSARLQLLAQSIPAQVWLTQVKADENLLDVSGFTLDPALLNDWVARLAASPLLKDQKLATLQVEHVSVALDKAAASETLALSVLPRPVEPKAEAAGRPRWSFSLLSAVAKPGAAP